MTQTDNHYTILNVSLNANMKQIKLAFRKQILIFHPDKNINMNLVDQQQLANSSSSKQKSMRIIEAYQCLSDRETRQKYDKYLQQQLNQHKIVNVRFKHTVNLSKCQNKQNKQNEQNEENIEFDNQDDDEMIVFACQQCCGENQVHAKDIVMMGQRREVSINCQFCGIYMTIQE